MPEIETPITKRLPQGAEVPTTGQLAYHAVVHVLVPSKDRFGQDIADEVAASAYISETLSEHFLDWAYTASEDVETGETLLGEADLQSPISIVVSDPYVTGSFLNNDEE